jgi:hypothetical protein
MKRFGYHEPVPMSRVELEEGLSSPDPERICMALVSAAFFEKDWPWAERRFIDLTTHANPDIRGLAANCLGHLARTHGTLHLDIVLPMLERLKTDASTAGQAEDALEDIKLYVVSL